MTEFPLDARDPIEALDHLLKNEKCRDHFFDTPNNVDNLVQGISDLQWLYEQSCELFKLDKTAALKLMFHIFFKTPSDFGMHHIFDSIGLYMEDAMNEDVCNYIRKYWGKQHSNISEADRAWWIRECASWHCILPA